MFPKSSAQPLDYTAATVRADILNGKQMRKSLHTQLWAGIFKTTDSAVTYFSGLGGVGHSTASCFWSCFPPLLQDEMSHPA